VAIGFDLYCQLLKQAISKLKGSKARPRIETVTHLDFVATNEAEYLMAGDDERARLAPAFLPVNYIEQPQTRIQAYKKLAEAGHQQQLDQLRKAWRDRFGPVPHAVENLLLFTEMKLAAATRKITKLEVKERKIMLTRGGDFVLIGGKFPRLSSEAPVEQLRELAALIRNF
ncbi:MAG TPA: TRCF domain-containing protein, partial [Chthoniobacteraceae bacterium]|nr:TRCF domain-containing protein [Chthoniobacteraceae bacterium]